MVNSQLLALIEGARSLTATSRYLAYQCLLIPGPLQGPGYALEAIQSDTEPHGPNEVEEILSRRRQLAEVLQASGAEITFVLDEGALRRPVGGSKAMADQLRYMVRHADKAGITILVAPYSAGLYPGIGFPYILLVGEDGITNIYRENRTGDTYLPSSDQDLVTMFDRVVELVLSQNESRQFVLDIAASYD